jgi:hypothetical protein
MMKYILALTFLYIVSVLQGCVNQKFYNHRDYSFIVRCRFTQVNLLFEQMVYIYSMKLSLMVKRRT